MFLGGRRSRAREAAAERTADHDGRVRLFTESVDAAGAEFRRSKMLAPVILLFALASYSIALLSGIKLDWQWGTWLDGGGRGGGPLWFVFTITAGIGTLLVAAAIAIIREKAAALARAQQRLDDVLAQGATDLTTLRTTEQ